MKIGEAFIDDKESWSSLISDFETLKTGAKECFTNEVALINKFDFKRFNTIISDIEIDQSFQSFAEYCCVNSLPVIILSEGMDYYIESILKTNNIDLPYFANKCELSEDKNNIGVSFPYSDAECSRCGCCKRNFILNMTGDDEISVYIGDGFSDVCAVKYADIVFAKGSLASYCWKNNISYFDFKDFSDIKKKLEVLQTKAIKQRQEAKFQRRAAYLCG